MKIILEQAELNEPEVIIRGNLADKKIQSVAAMLSSCDTGRKKHSERLELFYDEEQFYIDVKDIVYFLADDDTVSAYTDEGCYRSKTKLYKLKELLSEDGFAQINKSVLLNTSFVRSVQAEFSGNYLVTLKSTEEKLVISRRYFKEFKEKM